MIYVENVGRILECSVGFDYSYKDIDFIETEAKIDTGCSMTRISIASMFEDLNPRLIGEHKRYLLDKLRAGDPSLKLIKSVGVNDISLHEDLYSLSDITILNRVDIGFLLTVKDFTINGVNLGNQKVKFMYKYNSHTLVGMNILEQYKWRYSNGMFYLNEKSDKGLKKRIEELIFIKKQTISDVKKVLFDEYGDFSDEVIVNTIKDCYYEEERDAKL